MSKHPLDNAVEIVGSQAALAAALGVTKSAVNQWKDPGRRVPAEKCPDIERLTKGAVRCEDLRPDVSWNVLRATGHGEVAIEGSDMAPTAPVASPGPIHMFGPDDARERRTAPTAARLQHEIDTYVRPVSRLTPADRPSNHRERKG
jgi:DNA-binding transcriptional regulator YdaS (Cro superfamily)